MRKELIFIIVISLFVLTIQDDDFPPERFPEKKCGCGSAPGPDGDCVPIPQDCPPHESDLPSNKDEEKYTHKMCPKGATFRCGYGMSGRKICSCMRIKARKNLK